MEIWKDIGGYEGLFQVSSDGRFRRCSDGKIKSISYVCGSNRKKFYPIVNLNKSGKGRAFSVARLVAEAFIPNDEHFSYIAHKDMDYSNNKVSNLYWSHKNVHISRFLSKEILAYDIGMRFLGKYSSMSCASSALGVSVSSISRCCNGIASSVKGYRFKFSDNKCL